MMPPLSSSPLGARLGAVLEMLLATWFLSFRAHPAPLVLALELGWLFCTAGILGKRGITIEKEAGMHCSVNE